MKCARASCHTWSLLAMQGMYDRCPGWGWSDSKKLRELQHFSARILYCVAAGSENAVQPGRQSLSAAPRRKGSTVRLPFPKIVRREFEWILSCRCAITTKGRNEHLSAWTVP